MVGSSEPDVFSDKVIRWQSVFLGMSAVLYYLINQTLVCAVLLRLQVKSLQIVHTHLVQ